MARKLGLDRPNVAKCKRIARPLILKIHALTDLYVKFPQKLEFDVSHFTSAKVDGGNLRFTHPALAYDRLRLLQPFISVELYESYVEIYAIFRNVIVSICDYEKDHTTTRVPRLTSLCSLNVGKSIALGTKLTFWELNQAILFEPGTLPRHLQRFQTTLCDDIDEWLQMEPEHISELYRTDLLLGYVLHVLVINSRTLLHLLIPVLVHWLHEQESVRMRNLLRMLFVEFWLFLPHQAEYRETIDLSSGIICPSVDPSLPVFWLLHRIGFWRQMVSDLQLCSGYGTLAVYNTYESFLLDCLGRTTWLQISQVDPDEIYELLENNVQNPNNTNIIISVVSQQIEHLKRQLRHSQTSMGTYKLYNSEYGNVRSLVQHWLKFDLDCLFNSLDKGNEELFEAIFEVLKFSKRRCMDITVYLEKNLKSTRLASVREMLRKYECLLRDITSMITVLKVLCLYYLDLDSELAIVPAQIGAFSRFFSDLLGDHEEPEMCNFLLWVYGKGTLELQDLARLLFKHIFGEMWDSTRDLEHVHYILFGGE